MLTSMLAHRHRCLAPSLALLLACALLWGQWLGLAHRALHLPGTHAAQAYATEVGAAHDVLSHLLAPAEDAPDCRLYDQLGQGWATALPLLVVPLVFLPQGQSWVAMARPRFSACTPFSARAPPLR